MALRLDAGDILGVLTGNTAARAKIAGAQAAGLAKVQDLAKAKLHILGTLAGEKLGTPLFDSLAAGAHKGNAKAIDDLARDTTGYTLSQVKDVAASAGWAGLAVVALFIALLLRRRG